MSRNLLYEIPLFFRNGDERLGVDLSLRDGRGVLEFSSAQSFFTFFKKFCLTSEPTDFYDRLVIAVILYAIADFYYQKTEKTLHLKVSAQKFLLDVDNVLTTLCQPSCVDVSKVKRIALLLMFDKIKLVKRCKRKF